MNNTINMLSIKTTSFTKLITTWGVGLSVFWLLYNYLAFFISEDPVPRQGIILCTLGTLAAISLLLSPIQQRLAGLLTTLFALGLIGSVIYYSWQSIELLIFSLIFFGLPLLLPGLLLLFLPQANTAAKLANATPPAKAINGWPQIVLYILLLMLIIGVFFLGLSGNV